MFYSTRHRTDFALDNAGTLFLSGPDFVVILVQDVPWVFDGAVTKPYSYVHLYGEVLNRIARGKSRPTW